MWFKFRECDEICVKWETEAPDFPSYSSYTVKLFFQARAVRHCKKSKYEEHTHVRSNEMFTECREMSSAFPRLFPVSGTEVYKVPQFCYSIYLYAGGLLSRFALVRVRSSVCSVVMIFGNCFWRNILNMFVKSIYICYFSM